MQKASEGSTSVNNSVSGSSEHSTEDIVAAIASVLRPFTSSDLALSAQDATLEANSLATYRASQGWLGRSAISVATGSIAARPTVPTVPAALKSTQAFLGSANWPAGSTLTSTALVSTGLIASFVSAQPAPMAPGEATTTLQPFEQLPEQLPSQGFYSQDYAQAIALDQGTGIVPQVATAPPIAFSQQSAPQQSAANVSATDISATDTTVTQQLDGSWTLAYGQSSAAGQSATARQSAATQALIAQIARSSSANASSAAGDCLAASCKSLAYVDQSLPQARRKVLDIQRQLESLAEQHAQGDMHTYRTVLTKRLSEIAEQKSQTRIDLLGTRQYINEIGLRLGELDVASDWAEQLLAIDADYQANWQALQQIESRLLAEFSVASIDGTALNNIYSDYEDGQRSLYQSAQNVLGSYLRSPQHQTGDLAATVSQEPVAIDLLQALVMATHQQDVQQLRLETAHTATDKLQLRQQALVQSITQYEALQRELASTQALVTQYEQTRIEISANAVATTAAIDSARAKLAAEAKSASAISAAQVLESRVAHGSIAKMLLGIVVAAGTVAIAIKRTHGKLSEDLALEIVPSMTPQSGAQQRGRNPLGLRAGGFSQVKRLANPLSANLMSQLLDITGGHSLGFATQGPTFSGQSQPTPHPEAVSNISQLGRPSVADTSVGTELAIESMSRELTQMIQDTTPEGEFANAVSDKAIEPVKLLWDDVEGFAENAVRWVLRDLAVEKADHASAPHQKTGQRKEVMA